MPAGASVSFNVAVTGTPPFGFQWRKLATVLTNVLQTEPESTFTLDNVRTNDAGSYRVVVTNIFLPQGVASSAATLTVTAP